MNATSLLIGVLAARFAAGNRDEHEGAAAAADVALSLVLGFTAIWLGWRLAK